jgi:small subunit ribosomal protein S8e
MGITRDGMHKRKSTGGKRVAWKKKRKYNMGRQPAMTKIGPKKITMVRTRGGGKKLRALRLETGNFSWGSECITRKTRVLNVVYNANNNELVRTNTLVKNAIVQIDASPFRTWYEQHFGVRLGKTGAKKRPLAEVVKMRQQEQERKRKKTPKKEKKPNTEKGATKTATPKKAAKEGAKEGAKAAGAEAKAEGGEKAAKSAAKKGVKKAGEKKSGEKKAGEKKSGEKKAGEKKAGEKKAGEKKAGEKKAGEKKAGEKKAGEKKAAKKVTTEKEGEAKEAPGSAAPVAEAPKKEEAKEAPQKVKKAAKKASDITSMSRHVQSRLSIRQKLRVLDPVIEEQFSVGKLYACISSKPGKCGRADGYILEGKELDFYLKKMQKKQKK